MHRDDLVSEWIIPPATECMGGEAHPSVIAVRSAQIETDVETRRVRENLPPRGDDVVVERRTDRGLRLS